MKTQELSTTAPTSNHEAFVSVIIPCRNESKFISKCLDSVLSTTYPKNRLEVLVVDGMSEDGSREVVGEYARSNPIVRLLDNPRQFMPAGSNKGFVESRGDVVMFMGAHATYSPEYIAKCVAYLHQYGADNVGGVMQTQPSALTLRATAIAYFMSHRFGAGAAKFRSGAGTPMWVDTVFGGCYKREVFEKIGLFNETLVKTQDREFNQRLRDAGGKILLAPDIQCAYFARETLGAFATQLFRGGLWVYYGNRLSGGRFLSLRNFVPVGLLLVLVASLGIGMHSAAGVFAFLGMVAVYVLATTAWALKVAWERRDIRYLIAVPLVFALGHACYGVGSVCGIVKSLCVERAALCPAD